MTQWIKIDYDNIDTSKPPFDGEIVDLWAAQSLKTITVLYPEYAPDPQRVSDCIWESRIGDWVRCEEMDPLCDYLPPIQAEITHYMPLPEPPEDV